MRDDLGLGTILARRDPVASRILDGMRYRARFDQPTGERFGCARCGDDSPMQYDMPACPARF
jgi:hypothetical protein